MIKFVAKKYFDYFAEDEKVFEHIGECQKFVDKCNRDLKNVPFAWWEVSKEEEE